MKITNRELNKISRSDDAHVYLNIAIRSDDDSSELTNAEYSTTFNKEFIERGLDYHLAVVRFRVPLTDVPYMIFKIEEGLGQTQVGLGIYEMTMRYFDPLIPGFVDFSRRVTYLPTDLSISTPKPPSQNNGVQENSEWYYIYNVSRWIDLLNFTLQNIYNDLKTAYPGATINDPPFLELLDSGDKMEIVIPAVMQNSAQYQLYFNQELSLFFDGLDFLTEKINDSLYGRFLFNALPQDSNAYTPYGVVPSLPPTFFYYKQNYNAFEKWGDLRAIVFKTSLLPIRYENTNVRNIRGEISDDNILTDFNVAGFFGNRSDLTFFPQGPYRLVDILSNNGVRSLDIQLFWRDKGGFLRQLFISPGEELTMKLAFIKKHLPN